MPRGKQHRKGQTEIRTYTYYEVKDHDPVLDKMRTYAERDGRKIQEIVKDANLSDGTGARWFPKSQKDKLNRTKCPQFKTVAAFMGAIGYEVDFKPSTDSRRAFAVAKAKQYRKPKTNGATTRVH